jgi:transcriptional antiterminator NusG
MQVGEYVIIGKGPFEWSEGKIAEVNRQKGLVKVMVNLLGRETPVEIEFASITKK